MRWGDDAGRVPVGAILTVAILAGAGYGAYWALGEYGFLPESAPGVEASAPADAEAASQETPSWLEESGHEMPPLVKDEREDSERPALHQVEDWIWEINDDSWKLTVIREGEGDSDTSLADRQSLVLVAPTGELFLVTDELRNDYRMTVVDWDAETDTAWMRRGGRPGLAQVTELVMPTGEAIIDWDEGAVPDANEVDDGVGNVEVIGTQPDGLELWGAYDEGGYSTGVFWRDNGTFVDSLVDERIERAASQGFGPGDGLEAWIDAEGMRAVYHGSYTDPGSGKVEDEIWIVQDLSDDSAAEVPFDPPVPGCEPVDGARHGTYDGDRIVADCGGTEYLLDLFTGQPAQKR
ncbi:hypothetical protein [Demequina sp. NBRC 110057]|uniref:hypothetical protein n=1 Tax=Demequina sp. NBRC 110057 TaxID=1570346 RepID=UPI0011783035|nr:hypothetical protein [Demequina sp. NBRC 110057]